MRDSNVIQNRTHWITWFDVRKKSLGTWAFALNRITAIGITLYLFLHLIVLYTLTRGEEAWNTFVEVAKHPLVLVFDVVLIFGLLFHGLNGIRVALNGTGIGVRHHKMIFWVCVSVGCICLIYAAWVIFTI